ncbi:hypothetical protein BU17DRAFT_63538 [Hysterangium stoloniferum]|nr:hypothetical protein BU17DRAFT_63538 [Hysterangium stoloniferum]
MRSYRIHLSPGSRRTSSNRARGDAKKKSRLSQSTTVAPAPALNPTSYDEPPDSPPALVRATILPPLSATHPTHRSTYTLSRVDPSFPNPPAHSRSRSSTSGSTSSNGSPHSSYASTGGSPQLEPADSGSGVRIGGGVGAGMGVNTVANVLGLSHERTHSHPMHGHSQTENYPSYPNSYPPASSSHNGHGHPYAQRSHPPGPSYHISTSNTHHNPTPTSSFGTTLPPIHSLNAGNTTAIPPCSVQSSGGLGQVRVPQHPGPYPPYHSYPSYPSSYASNPANGSSSTWAPSHDPPSSYSTQNTSNWWNNVGVSVGVGVGAGTGGRYGGSYGT